VPLVKLLLVPGLPNTSSLHGEAEVLALGGQASGRPCGTRRIADTFLAWWRSLPVDCGNACRRGIQRYLRDGTPGASAASERVSLAQARITHHHPLSDAAVLGMGRLRTPFRDAGAQQHGARLPAMRQHPAGAPAVADLGTRHQRGRTFKDQVGHRRLEPHQTAPPGTHLKLSHSLSRPDGSSSMPIELFNDGRHKCLMFSDLSDSGSAAVQANQFLVVDGDTGAVIDPGGNLAYNELYLGMQQHFPPHKLASILASHADPDIIAALDRWMTSTSAKLYISTLWERFAPHFCKPGKTAGRIVGIPDAGMRIGVGSSTLWAVPAHFMHAEGNFQFWDPVSHILFSGDLGVSLGGNPRQVIASLAHHLPLMEPFHRRYMVSGKILKLWARMVAELPIRMIVPQHGSPLTGAAVGEFIAWVQTLDCGIDRMQQADYALPA
jgi:glyoxylase-like metal-dependent hydrolase (beta-lactamase superfamily II)